VARSRALFMFRAGCWSFAPTRSHPTTTRASYYDKSFAPEKTLILYCASGLRAALAGKVLKDMGYREVYNLGAFKDWAESGGSIERSDQTR
jgi:rhodanese-related sulfurtransferase